MSSERAVSAMESVSFMATLETMPSRLSFLSMSPDASGTLGPASLRAISSLATALVRSILKSL